MKNLKIFTNNIEEEAINQINILLEQEAFKDSKIRIMPDVHAGKGCVIGFTGDLGTKVIPNIVGVDIGCGMLTIKLGNIELNLEDLDNIIHKYVPSGFQTHNKIKHIFNQLEDLKCYSKLKNTDRLHKSIGTLGGGNHFIEIDIDEEENKYLVIHTGSRNLGTQVVNIYQDLAIKGIAFKNNQEFLKKQNEIIQEYRKANREDEIQKAIMELKNEIAKKTSSFPKGLAYLDGQERTDYLHDMQIGRAHV